MTPLQAWLTKPRAHVRIDTSVRWGDWMNLLRRPFLGRCSNSARPRFEVLDRLALGGKKSLLLVSIEGCRLLVGVGEEAAPSISPFDELRLSRRRTRATYTGRARRMVRP